MKGGEYAMTEPIACALTPEQIVARKASLLPRLSMRADQVEPREDGYAFAFTASTQTLTAIAETIDAERQCCRFLRFVLTVESSGGPLTLTVTGPAGTREFLNGLLQP